MIKNPSTATVQRIIKGNNVEESAIQLANSGGVKLGPVPMAENAVEVELPAGDAKVRYYRPKFTFE